MTSTEKWKLWEGNMAQALKRCKHCWFWLLISGTGKIMNIIIHLLNVWVNTTSLLRRALVVTQKRVGSKVDQSFYFQRFFNKPFFPLHFSAAFPWKEGWRHQSTHFIYYRTDGFLCLKIIVLIIQLGSLKILDLNAWGFLRSHVNK